MIQYSGHKIRQNEIDAVVEVMKSGWLGLSTIGRLFEKEIASLMTKNFGVFVNSGSSANLLAIIAAKKFYGWKDGDEIIVSCCGFPTSINPIIQNNLCPVFVDIDIKTLNTSAKRIKEAISSKTKGVVLVHSLGFPCELDEITNVVLDNNLILIEDCCDALCSQYKNTMVGAKGAISTTSFYPAHLISTGGGGMVCVNNEELNKIIRSLACWGRACNCHGENGNKKDGICGKRFDKWLDGSDEIYDHKYLYSNIGYCLENNEIAAAIGHEQLKRLNFITTRREDIFYRYYDGLGNKYRKYFYFIDFPVCSKPIPFCFPLTIKESAPFKRQDIVKFLEDSGIQTRQFFGGNLLLHGIYEGYNYRISGALENSNYVTFNTFFIGVWEEMTEEQVDYVIDKFDEFIWRSTYD